MRQYISQRAELVRAYYAGIGKTAVIYPAAFTVALGIGHVTLGMVFFAMDVFQAPPARIGWLAGTWSALYIVGCLLVRPAFHRVLPRYLIIGSTLLMGLLVLGMQMAPALWMVSVLYGLFGAAMALFWPPLMGWLSSDSEGAALSRTVSRFNLMWCAGNIISPYLCGLLTERSVRLPLFVGAGLFLLTAAFAAGAAAVLPQVRSDAETGAEDAALNGTGRGTPLRFPAWVGLAVSCFGLGIVAAVFPVAAREQLQLSEGRIGLLLLWRGMCNLAGFVVLGRVVFWHFRVLPMLVPQAVAAVVFAGLAHTRSVWLAGGLLGIIGLTGAMSYSESIFHGASGSGNRARRMAIHESVLALGLVTGAGVGGWVYQLHGMTRLFMVGAAVMLAGLLTQGALCLDPRRQRGPLPPT